jgi:hypothetical protein
MSYDVKLEKLKSKIKERVPEFEMMYKSDSKLMRVLGKIMFFAPGFMDSVTTTLGKKVYMGNNFKNTDPLNTFVTLSHEYVHVMDYVKKPIRFVLGYAFPQILALLSLLSFLAFFSPWFLLCLLFLLFLAPVPAPFRKDVEVRGYGMSIKQTNWIYRECNEQEMERYVSKFSGSTYYFMWPFKSVRKELDAYNNSSIPDDENPAYKDVYEIINESV